MALNLEVKKFIIYLKFKPIKLQYIADNYKIIGYAYYTPENRLWCYYNHINKRLFMNRDIVDEVISKLNFHHVKKINIVDFEETFIEMILNNYKINLNVKFIPEEYLILHVNKKTKIKK